MMMMVSFLSSRIFGWLGDPDVSLNSVLATTCGLSLSLKSAATTTTRDSWISSFLHRGWVTLLFVCAKPELFCRSIIRSRYIVEPWPFSSRVETTRKCRMSKCVEMSTRESVRSPWYSWCVQNSAYSIDGFLRLINSSLSHSPPHTRDRTLYCGPNLSPQHRIDIYHTCSSSAQRRSLSQKKNHGSIHNI